jgi:pyridoxamine 5'-phosphate oxidase family protein
MSVFTEAEIAYLTSQRLGRMATIGSDGAPHVVPVSFRFNAVADSIDIGGHDLGQTRKWRDLARDPRIAFVVDDVRPPWQPRLIEIRGVATLLATGGSHLGRGFANELIRITPRRIVTYGVNDGDASDRFHVRGRDVEPGSRDPGPTGD